MLKRLIYKIVYKLVYKLGNIVVQNYRRLVKSTYLITFCYFVIYYISSLILIIILVKEKIYSLENLNNIFIFLFKNFTSFIYLSKLLIKFSFPLKLWSLFIVILLNLINFSLIPLLVFNLIRFPINWRKNKIFWIVQYSCNLIPIYVFIYLISLKIDSNYRVLFSPVFCLVQNFIINNYMISLKFPRDHQNSINSKRDKIFWIVFNLLCLMFIYGSIRMNLFR